jgi:hypothetical protein
MLQLLSHIITVKTDRHTNQSEYVYQTSELAGIIAHYTQIHNFAALNAVLSEIFSVCNSGRRPWSYEAERTFLQLTITGCALLTFLRIENQLQSDMYRRIDPLRMATYLDNEVDRISDSSTAGILTHLIDIYLQIFICWTVDIPETVVLPDIEVLTTLLETQDDDTFAKLLTAFARTKDPRVHALLIDFSNDDEQEVITLAKHLLLQYF